MRVTCEEVLSAPVDPVSELLLELRLDRVLCCRSELTEPWGMSVPLEPGQIMFHAAITEGCFLVDGGEVRPIEPGTYALVTKPGVHQLRGRADADCPSVFELPTRLLGERMELMEHGGGGARATMICGVARLVHPMADRVVEALPDVVHFAPGGGSTGGLASEALRSMIADSLGARLGGASRISLLTTLLVLEGLREWFGSLESHDMPRWLAALRDPHLGPVLARVHANPAERWPVARLASIASMSRSSFHDAFRKQLGESPARYVARVRFGFAKTLLASPETSIAEVAYACGYESESSFSRAFRREVGMSPTAARAHVRSMGS